jgi:hypothetical protein
MHGSPILLGKLESTKPFIERKVQIHIVFSTTESRLLHRVIGGFLNGGE